MLCILNATVPVFLGRVIDVNKNEASLRPTLDSLRERKREKACTYTSCSGRIKKMGLKNLTIELNVDGQDYFI